MKQESIVKQNKIDSNNLEQVNNIIFSVLFALLYMAALYNTNSQSLFYLCMGLINTWSNTNDKEVQALYFPRKII